MATMGCARQEEPTTLYEEMRAADKMVFATMSVSKTARLEDSEWYKLGKRIAVYSYDTYIEAYIDMSKLKDGDITFDDKTRTVSITLPAVETQLAGRDMEMKKEYENVGIFRSDIDAKERAAMKEQANRKLKEELEKDGKFRRQLTEAAERKARQYFESLLKDRGYKATVEFGTRHNDYKPANIARP